MIIEIKLPCPRCKRRHKLHVEKGNRVMMEIASQTICPMCANGRGAKARDLSNDDEEEAEE